MPDSPIPTLPVGYKLASNTVLKVLGQGPCGATYLVRDVRAEGDISVIKESLPEGLVHRDAATMQVLPLEATGEGVEKLRAAQEAFTAEAKALEGVHHPSVVAVSRVFSALGTTYATMEYLPGYTVAEWCAKNGAPTREQLSYLLTTLLTALKHLHANGMAHGDIRAEHVRFRENGVPVLIDFGQARKAVQASTGSAEISALERSAEDLFALGAMARRLITGEEAASGNRPAPLAKNPKLVSAYGRSLLAGIDKAMATTKEKAWTGAEEWLDALQGRLLSAPTRRLFGRVAATAAAVGVLGFGAYEGVQYLRNRTENPAASQPTDAQRAQEAYDKGMACLLDDCKEGLRLLEEAAGLGHMGAVHKLVECYAGSDVTECNEKKLMRWATVAADHGDKAACKQVAFLYRDGWGDEAEEIQKNKDLRKAAARFRTLATQGDAEAQYELAMCHADEAGPCHDRDEVEKWLTAAAGQGHREAQIALADFYADNGIYTKTSVHWFKTAYEAGHKKAAYHLGIAYWEGNGVDRDAETKVEMARKLFSEAADDVPDAAYRLGFAIFNKEIPGSGEEVKKYLGQAVAHGKKEALLPLAQHCARSSDEQDVANAMLYYKQAAGDGDANATKGLAELWLAGYRSGCTCAELRNLLERDEAATNGQEKLYNLHDSLRFYLLILPDSDTAFLPDNSPERLSGLGALTNSAKVGADVYAILGLLKNDPGYFETSANKRSELGKALMAYSRLKKAPKNYSGKNREDDLVTLSGIAKENTICRPLLCSRLGHYHFAEAEGHPDYAKAEPYLRVAANVGDARSKYEYACCLAQKEDPAAQAQALELFTSYAAGLKDDAKTPEAIDVWERLALLHGKGTGGQADAGLAAQYCQKAAKAGSYQAAIELGRYYFAEAAGAPDTAKAEPFLRIAAAKDAASQYRYACCTADDKEAFKALTEYAKTLKDSDRTPEAIDAWERLAAMHAKGTGTTKNTKTAASFCEKAANAGSYKTALEMGRYYFDEAAGHPKHAEAEPFLAVAVKSGDARSKYEYACCLLKKRGRKNEAAAFNQLTAYAKTLSDDDHSPEAIDTWKRLANMYENGTGTKKDKKAAQKYRQKAEKAAAKR